MKTNFTYSLLKKITAFTSLALLLGITSCTVTESINEPVAKKSATKKNKEVKIYPDIIKKQMHVKNAADEQLDFFVFDNEGTIKVHYKMNEKEHKKFSGLDKGTYTYQVFKKDEMRDPGKIIIK
jgi:hypothetical protein